jgi:hypothetical protein
MPRQIIDTESSRPAYLRRRLVTLATTIVVVAAVAGVALLVWGRHLLPAGH